tara:strand:+ start:95500 stop:95700 length:201 start_codon:yes stop_codon:yes gene_type:complete
MKTKKRIKEVIYGPEYSRFYPQWKFIWWHNYYGAYECAESFTTKKLALEYISEIKADTPDKYHYIN